MQDRRLPVSFTRHSLCRPLLLPVTASAITLRVESFFYRTCLKEELTRRCEANPRYSLRAFGRSLGFEASNLSQMIAGKRVPTLKSAQRLVAGLELDPPAKRAFFSSLVEAQRARGATQLKAYLPEIAESAQTELSLQLFRVIADWYHYAILALTQTRDFKGGPKQIAASLGITELEAKLAIERLTRLGLLEVKRGKLTSTNNGFTTADKEVTGAALKKHQRQILLKAIASLESDPLEERSVTSLTMAINPKKLPEAKRRLEKFTKELCDFLEEGPRTRVYEMSLALFPLQKKEET